MSKKVLILSGSPRKGGNSDILCDEFMRGALEAGNTVEKIRVAEKKIGYCSACYYCVQSGGVCARKDDMAEILQKLIDADVIVLSSPVYFYSIDAQLKAVIDRSVARWTEIKNKEFYYIVTCADNAKASQETTIACFRGLADCVEGAIEKAIINDAGWHRQFPRFLLRTRPPKPSLCHWSRQQATVIAPRERRLFPVCFRRRGTVFFHALQKTGFSYSLNCCKKTRYGAGNRTRTCMVSHWNLNPACLPIPPCPRIKLKMENYRSDLLAFTIEVRSFSISVQSERMDRYSAFDKYSVA